MNCESSCSTLAYHKRYSNIISGGLQNGEVCIWDVRSAAEPCIIADKTHNGYVNCLRWSPKNNFELLSGSSNGEVFWWDIRKMNESPCEFKIELIKTDEKETLAGGKADNLSIDSTEFRTATCSSVEFDKVHSKYIRIGTGDGRVILAHKNGNKVEKTDERKCHEVSVSTITQNWASFKCILTVDSGDVKVWGEDMKNDPIFSVSSIDNEFSCGAWSLTRLACHNLFLLHKATLIPLRLEDTNSINIKILKWLSGILDFL